MLDIGHDISSRRYDGKGKVSPPSRPEDYTSFHAILREELSSRLDIALLEIGNREESEKVVVNVSILSALFDPHSINVMLNT